MQPVKIAVKVESELTAAYKDKLQIDEFPLPETFKIFHGWVEEDEGIEFWLMSSYLNTYKSTYLDSSIYRFKLGDFKRCFIKGCQKVNTLFSEENVRNLNLYKRSVSQTLDNSQEDMKNKDLSYTCT